ncbi:MAG: PD-(D/E)XK nuclease family protein [Bacteroidales bacterium]|jgi:CRISPR/Cas system-associated exonuclease Cas4 (RecB family)|nr:PD-(D/E)XK nuclease family protein [Bacteroidales bacterium]
MIDRKPFLQQVAEDIAKSFSKAEFTDTKIILPSKRIRLFFNKYLSQLQTPISVEEEQYSTISELLFSFSDLRPIGITEPTEKIKLVAELYRVYRRVFESTETFDDFYFLGETLLEDFNTIDKYIVDSDKLFGNLSALEKYKSFDYLNIEQRDIIRKFFNKNTVLKERFFDFWDKLSIVYKEYSEQLRQKKIAYEGLFLRRALSEAEAHPEKFSHKKYIFIGFDFINKIEERLFSLLKEQGKAVFYNDDIGKQDDIRDALNPAISVVRSGGMSAQAEIIPKWLQKIDRKDKDATDAAIVLCDEKILPVVIDVVPEEEQPNTAILFDLVQTPFAVCLMRVLMDAPVEASVKILQELLQKEIDLHVSRNPKRQDVVFIGKMLHDLNTVLADENIQMEPATFIKLLRRILISMKIPYLGEPARGLQILAPVDTKNMDFEHILMLSVNEGVMPKTSTDGSFIPPFVRRHFDMPTQDDEQKQQAHIFWRLLTRSNSATIVYCDGKTITSKNEKSRFIRQLQLEFGQGADELSLQAPFTQSSSTQTLLAQDSIRKTPEMLQKISEKTFSPSMLNAYIDCSLRFYLKYILGAIDSSDKDELNAAILGSVFHRSMEIYYRKEFLDVSGGRECSSGEENLEKIIEQAFTEVLNDENIKLSKDKEGEKHIYRTVIEKMFNNTIAYDSTQPFEIMEMESENYKWQILLNNGNKIDVGGTIDRIDKGSEVVRIIDYKTGIMPDSKKLKSDYDTDISVIFSPERKKKSSYLLQILLYSYCYSKNNPDVKTVSPVLYFPLKNNESETPILDVPNCDYVEFEQYLKTVLENIFDISKPFKKCDNPDTCRYCDYKLICNRENF